MALGDPRMGPALRIQLVIVSVPTTYAKQSWSAEEVGAEPGTLAICWRYQHKAFCLPQTAPVRCLPEWLREAIEALHKPTPLC